LNRKGNHKTKIALKIPWWTQYKNNRKRNYSRRNKKSANFDIKWTVIDKVKSLSDAIFSPDLPAVWKMRDFI